MPTAQKKTTQIHIEFFSIRLGNPSVCFEACDNELIIQQYPCHDQRFMISEKSLVSERSRRRAHMVHACRINSAPSRPPLRRLICSPSLMRNGPAAAYSGVAHRHALLLPCQDCVPSNFQPSNHCASSFARCFPAASRSPTIPSKRLACLAYINFCLLRQHTTKRASRAFPPHHKDAELLCGAHITFGTVPLKPALRLELL
jgi:hypothetical protein